jgi:hypothetical protein
MGMVPIPNISPLTIPRFEEPVLEPPFPVSRIDPESSNTGAGADEGYSPSHHATPHQNPDTPETQPHTAPDPDHQVNFFA